MNSVYRSKFSSFRDSNSKLVVVIGAAVLIILASLATYYFVQYRHLQTNPQSASQSNSQKIINEVGKIYNLPTGEQPTVAEIKDISKLQGQAFFKGAQDGDYLLIYSNAKIALIYRQSTNQLINVGPVEINNNSTTGS